ncbi:hypothetical protein PS934_05026 [Pseudomonas fluorescens]|uniref:hypothetical protein n=1 Tax=Pseudomonas fluorescens TaxID=294 RepID=UPI00123F0B21|nr:hypothetical protein [Pseudomonas fluorescens]VVQ20703.1 hypothetical protein PS934_05026 [Pseudomonas fluorescens]
MAYNTGNAPGSTHPKDLIDNAEDFDYLLTEDGSHPNRLGVPLKSWKGMEGEHNADQTRREAEFDADQTRRESEFDVDQVRRESEFDLVQAERVVEFNHLLESSGFEIPVDYAAGLGITRPTQVLRFGGELYRAHDSALPFTTSTWAADSAKLFSMGDASVRQEHANATDPVKGAAMIGRAMVSIPSIANLLLQPRREDLRFSVDSYYAGAGVGGNIWRWDNSSTAQDDYGSVLAVAGVTTGRFLVVKKGREFSAYEYGVRAANTGTDNRLRLVALYKRLHGSANTVHMIDEDFNVDDSRPIIFPADTTTIWGSGWLTTVRESPLLPASSAANPDGTFKVYGGIFGGGDPITGSRYSETNFIYRGRCTWVGVKIRNSNGLTAASGYSSHGIIAHGGINVYIDCQVDDMPNTGIVTTMFREAHYIRTKCRRNGLLGGGGARNGISNTSTYSFPSYTFPVEDRTTKLSVINGEYRYSYEEGIQFANVPFVWIEGPDCRDNLDRAIEGDTAYAQASQTRPNDQIHIYGADCRGVPGPTNYSISLNDGFNKDVFIGGCRFGGGKLTEVSANCSAVGSFTFTSRNKFDLTSTGLLSGCHAIYVNAGLIDLLAGFTVRGNHDRSTFNAAMVSANNDIAAGDVFIGNIDSNVKFTYSATAKLASVFKSRSVTCPTARSFAQLTLTANAALIEVVDSNGLMNQDAATDQGLVRLLGLDTYTLDTLDLRSNRNDVNAATRFPVASSATAIAGRITKLFSSGNYWKGYSFNGGAERLTALAGLAAKTSANDLPVLM